MKKIFILFFLFACSAEKKNDIYYVIKHPKPAKSTTDTSMVPPPPPPSSGFYGHHNFILVDTSNIYYYYNEHRFLRCGTGRNIDKPPFINLHPAKLIRIEFDKLRSFLDTSFPDSVVNSRDFMFSIASPTDTIKNRAFVIIADYLKSKNKNIDVIRNWTEEEHFVLDAKLTNTPYDPENLTWKNGFDAPPIFKTMRFVPPEIEDDEMTDTASKK